MPVVDVHGDLNAACVQAALSRRQSFLLAESKALHRRDEYCGSGFAGTPQGDWSDMADFAAATSFPYWGSQFGSAVRQRRLIRNLIGKVQADSIRYPSTDGLREMSEIRQFIVPTDKPKSTP